MNLFEFYQISFLVACISGGVLSHIGKHYYSRGNILEFFFLSQLTLLGNLLSQLFFYNHSTDEFVGHSIGHSTDWMGIGLSYLLFALGKLFLYWKNLKVSEQGTLMIGGYLILLALQYFLIGFFPQLDSHMNSGFFGNMVTASLFENIVLISTFFLFIIFYLFQRKSVQRKTIEINLLNAKDDSFYELLLFSLPLVVSLYSLGFLYTMSYLLLPVLFLGSSFKNEKTATFALILISTISSTGGLFLSISFERISTSAMQILLLFLILLIFQLLIIAKNKKNRHNQTN